MPGADARTGRPGSDRTADLPAGSLCRYRSGGAIRVGLVTATGILPTSLASVLDGIVDGRLDPRLEREVAANRGQTLDPADLGLLAPLDPRTMLYCGRNYEDHLAENPRPRQASPVFFSKLVSSLIGDREAIRIQSDQHVDYEGELVVVIGRTARHVPLERALEHVAGYTIANDVSDRAVQHVNNQITMGKGPDTFGPLGPVVVPRATIGDGSGLRIRTWVNDELRQDGSTSDLIHDVAACIVAATRTVTLQPGDIIATGTPAGTGAYMDPPAFLQSGDRVTVAVDGLGALSNPVERDTDS
jgi:2-keto-4-pentenoate hydratase/2-oxohepta-3-ene-1,7-dioic acid hydratase in catechol pathway